MKALKIAVISLLVLVGLFVAVGFMLPSEFHVQRKVVIDATPDKVYRHIVDLREWKKWGVWFQRDPNMQVTYTGPVAEVGMKSSWVSEQEGSGEMTISALTAEQNVTYSLYFPDFDMESTGELTLSADGDKTIVSWADYGDVGSNPLNHYFAAMMDSMVGPDFEAGLQNLKTLVESQ